MFAQFRSDYHDLEDSETIQAFKQHVSYLSSAAMEGRKAGSAGEKAAADYIANLFEENGIVMLNGKEGDTFMISRQPGDTITSRNVMGVVQGYDPALRDKYIVVGARMDNLGVNVLPIDGKQTEQIYYGANGNASGIAMLLELAKKVATNDVLFRRSVIFVAFGASREGLMGSWYFLNRSFPDVDKIDAMINLDMLATGEELLAYTASNGDMNAFLGTMTRSLQPILPTITTQEPYPSDHRSFYSSEIPSVFFTTGLYPDHDSPRDTESILNYDIMERELEYFYSFTVAIANTSVMPNFKGDAYSGKDTDDKAYAFGDCDVKPSFMNSNDPRRFIQKWVYQYLRYPDEAVSQGIQGRVHVQFTVEKDGKVSDVKVTKGTDPLLDAEAVRVVSASPKWKPAKIKGKPVRCYITIPVDFILTDKKSKLKLKK